MNDHPLALAEARTHPWDDVIRAAQARGDALDARVAALAAAEATDAAREEIAALVREIGAAANHAGPWRPVDAWARARFAALREDARRLFGADGPEVNIPPAWRR